MTSARTNQNTGIPPPANRRASQNLQLPKPNRSRVGFHPAELGEDSSTAQAEARPSVRDPRRFPIPEEKKKAPGEGLTRLSAEGSLLPAGGHRGPRLPARHAPDQPPVSPPPQGSPRPVAACFEGTNQRGRWAWLRNGPAPRAAPERATSACVSFSCPARRLSGSSGLVWKSPSD